MSAPTLYRCKAIKPNGERVDGCGWQGELPARGMVVDRCPMCNSPHLSHVLVATVRAADIPNPTVELLPGVYISADGSARGPGLEAALACAADVATLDVWAASLTRTGVSHGWQSHALGQDTAECYGKSRGRIIWSRTAATPSEARRAAADAIRNGRIPS